MISRKFKVLVVVDGKEYVFSPFSFKSSMSQFKARGKEQGKTSEDVFTEIAETAYVSVDAIKNWMYGKNGPADLETVKRISTKLGIEYMDLLKEQEKEKMDEKKMANSNYVDMNRTKDVIRVVYQKMAAYMDTLVEELCTDIDEATYYALDAAYNDMVRTLHQSMLDIPMDIYDKLEKVMEGDLFFYFYGEPELGLDIWDFCEYEDYCQKNNYNIITGRVYYMESKAKEFYDNMREILKDYLV